MNIYCKVIIPYHHRNKEVLSSNFMDPTKTRPVSLMAEFIIIY